MWYAQCIAKRDTKHFLVKVEEAFTSTLLVTGGNHERHVSRRAIHVNPAIVSECSCEKQRLMLVYIDALTGDMTCQSRCWKM